MISVAWLIRRWCLFRQLGAGIPMQEPRTSRANRTAKWALGYRQACLVSAIKATSGTGSCVSVQGHLCSVPGAHMYVRRNPVPDTSYSLAFLEVPARHSHLLKPVRSTSGEGADLGTLVWLPVAPTEYGTVQVGGARHIRRTCILRAP